MKKALIIFCVIFTILECGAQTVVTPIWMKTEVSSAAIYADAWGVDVDESGNVYWAYNSNNMGQALDLTCVKYDPNGNPLWSTPLFYGGIGRQQAFIIDASDTALYIGGKDCTFNQLIWCDMLLLKVNKADGSLIWDKEMNFSGNGYEELDGLVLRDDGIYCGGWAHELQNAIYKSEMGFWKLDYAGNTIWTNHFGKVGSAEHQDGHFVVDDNNIYAAGLWDGNDAGKNGHSILAKFDKSNGNFVDSILFGTQSNVPGDLENVLGMTSYGDYLYLTGFTTPPGTNDLQIFVAKYDKNFNQQWYTMWGGSGADAARGIKVVDDVVCVAGKSSSPSIMTTGNRDGVVVKLDTLGTVMSYFTWGDSLENNFEDIYVDSESIYLSGASHMDSDSTAQAFLIKIGNSTSGIDEPLSYDHTSFNVFPNPSHGNMEITFNNEKHSGGSISIVDVQGRLIAERDFTETETSIHFPISSDGVFYVTVDNNSYRVTKKIVNVNN